MNDLDTMSETARFIAGLFFIAALSASVVALLLDWCGVLTQ